MLPGHLRERTIGMRYYISSTPGIGGRVKETPTDFRVTEQPGITPEPIDADPGAYPFLVVEATATDRDTHDLLASLAAAMDIHPQQIAVSGTKDANAVTTQWLTINKVEPADLVEIAGVDLAVVGRYGRQLEFGDHEGNTFEVVVRNASNPDRIGDITEELTTEDGAISFPNYFGHQRFGIRRVNTHEIGRHLLAADYESAVTSYLTESSAHEPERTRQAREDIASALVDGDTTAALDATPGYLHHEKRMLNVLVEEGPEAYQAAFEALPWSLQHLFIHAVQSYVFNEVVSERLRRRIPLDRPTVGDAVCFADEDGRIDPSTVQLVTDRRLNTTIRHCNRGKATVVGPLIGGETLELDGEPGCILDSILSNLGIERESFATNPISKIEGSWRPYRQRTDLTTTLDPPRFRFSLDSGTYATVLLREYLKVDPLQMV